MSAEGKSKRGASGQSNAKAKPFRGNGGQVNPAYMREIYAMAGLKKISPFIGNGQTGDSKYGGSIGPKAGYYNRRTEPS